MDKKSMREKIIEALQEGCTFAEIQLRCGSPSKKFIKQVIKEEDPVLFEIMHDTKKLKNYRNRQYKRFRDETV